MDSVQHLQSATQLVTLSGVSILTDPWLTDGEYYGSWYHIPKFPESRISQLRYDYIYVSHIHPDHCSEDTFAKLDKSKLVLIPKFKSVFLKKKIEGFGFNVEELEHARPKTLCKDVRITIYLADNCDPELCGRYFGCAVAPDQMSPNIDSLALIENGEYRILNTNDCPYQLAAHTIIENRLNENIDFLSVGYAGAGPFPQCFEFQSAAQKVAAADRKEKQFLTMAANYVELIQPRHFSPFAGTYVLGGGLGELNSFRGVPDIKSVVTKIDNIINAVSGRGVVLNVLDTFDLQTNEVLKIHADPIDTQGRLEEINQKQLNIKIPETNRSVFDILCEAHKRFLNVCVQNEVESSTKIFIQTENERIEFSTSAPPRKVDRHSELTGRFLKITVDENMLKCILFGPRYAHWNNALIGSHLRISRNPDVYERDLFHCLNFLHI